MIYKISGVGQSRRLTSVVDFNFGHLWRLLALGGRAMPIALKARILAIQGMVSASF